MKFLLLLTVAATVLLVSIADAQRGCEAFNNCRDYGRHGYTHSGKRSVSEAGPATPDLSQNADDGLDGGPGAGDGGPPSRSAEKASGNGGGSSGCIPAPPKQIRDNRRKCRPFMSRSKSKTEFCHDSVREVHPLITVSRFCVPAL